MKKSIYLIPIYVQNCEISDQDAGLSVLLVTPIVLWISQVFLRLFSWAGNNQEEHLRPGLGQAEFLGLLFRGDLEDPYKKSRAIAFYVSITLSLLSVFIVLPNLSYIGRLFIFGLWLFGTSFLTVSFAVWRLFVFLSPQKAIENAFWIPLLLVLPAIPMALNLTDSWNKTMSFFWIMPGLGGYITVPLFFLLFTEACIRGKKSYWPLVGLSGVLIFLLLRTAL